MKQTRITRKWDSRQFVAGGQEVINLPIGNDMESLMFYLTGSIDVTTAFSTVRSEGISRLIRKVDILLDGQTVATISGAMLSHGNFQRESARILVSPLTTVGNHSCESFAVMDFANIGGVRPKDTNLKTRGARSFQAMIQWGQLSDVFTGAGVATTSLTLHTMVRETKEPDGAQEPEALRLYRYMEKGYSSSQEDRIQLDPNVLYRAIMLRGEINGERSPNVITAARVQIGSEVIFDLTSTQIEDINSLDGNFVLPSGYMLIDFAPSPDGLVKLSDMCDTHGHADAYLILTVNGGATNKVCIVSHEIEVLHHHIARNKAKREFEAA